MAKSKKLNIAFICIAVTLVITIFKNFAFPHYEVENSKQSKNNKSVIPTKLNIQSKGVTGIGGNNLQPTYQLSNSNVELFIDDYLHKNNPDHSVLNLAEILHTNNYDKEIVDILSEKIETSLNEGKEISIETFQMVRTAIQKNGSLDDYKALLSSIPNDYPLKPQLLSEMSSYLSQQGDLYDAENMLLDGLQMFPKNPSMWDAYASFLKSNERFNEAESAYNRILAIEDTAETRLSLGKLYLENDNLSAAQQMFEHITKTVPEYKEEISKIMQN